MTSLKVSIYNQQSDLAISRPSIRALVREVVSYEGKSFEEVAIHFVDSKKICDLHFQFFNDPSPTDCISFPLDESFMGDVFVCPAVAIIYASSHHKDPYRETSLYVVHALLHLMGYDDIEKNQR